LISLNHGLILGRGNWAYVAKQYHVQHGLANPINKKARTFYRCFSQRVLYFVGEEAKISNQGCSFGKICCIRLDHTHTP